jgi:Flp pilus assembly pilin Flp
MMRRLATFFKRYARDERGVAGVEFAVMLPAIFIMFLGVVEISNFVMVNQRTEKMAHNLADLIAQSDGITTTQINTIMDASSEIMKPFEFGPRGHVIITSVHRNAGQQPRVAWQYEGGGDLDEVESNFGSTGFGSVLPSGFTLNERETVIIAEVFYDHRSLITDMFSSGERMYKYAFYKPRLGALDTVQSQ